ncbi:MAG TPA: mechanosensitive ion channel [Thermoguttaceae bacterium]|nr:mechanosensitive ion channel [Thermoguttaceae bacterium]
MLAQAAPQTSGVSEAIEETGADINRAYETLVPYLPNLLGALAILIVGWLGAVLIAFIVRVALRRTGLDRKLAEWCAGEGAEAPRIERGVAKGTYYLVLILVLVAFFDTLGLTRVTESLNSLLSEVLTYLPRIVGAALLLLAAWIIATVVRFVARRVTRATRLDERVSSQAALEREEPVAISNTIANTAYWLVFLLFLPAILDTLALGGLLGPVQEMVTEILAFLPNLFAAVLILGIGWLVARIVQQVTTNLLAAVGTDALSERVGLAPMLGKWRFSAVLGLVVYILILLPVLVASLNALQLTAVTEPASAMLNMVLTALPAIFAAVLVVFFAYIVGRVVAGLVTNLLTGVGFNSLPAKLGLTKEKAPVEGQRTLSEVAGYLLLVATMLFATMQALPILGFDMLAELISQFLVFAGHVLLGLVIFGIGLYLANLAAQTLRASGAAQANLLSIAARVSILVLAGAMALRQMGLANEIITSAFTIVLGAMAVALALAFGLGGREAAGRALDRFVESRSPEDFLRPKVSEELMAKMKEAEREGAERPSEKQPSGAAPESHPKGP